MKTILRFIREWFIYNILVWFTKGWWNYLFAPKNWIQKSYNINWITIIRCRINGHTCGVGWYNLGGLEPDMHCRNCFDDLG